MTKSEHIRELAADGYSAVQIGDMTGFDRRLVHKALRVGPKRGRPATLARCPHCGQPIPAKLTERA